MRHSLRFILMLIIATYGSGMMAGDEPSAPRNAAVLPSGSGSEAQYLQQLLSRGLFDLAEACCERRLAAAITPDEQAAWELLLSECYRRHAWGLESVNRQSLISHAVERLTEFLQENTIAPTSELVMRLRQTELLTEAVRMQFLIQQAGRWFVPEGTEAVAARAQRTAVAARMVAFPSNAASQAMLLKARELTEALLQQVDQIRRDLDSSDVRMVREKAREVLCEISLLQAGLSPTTADSQTELQAVGTTAQQLARATTDSGQKFRLALRAAEAELLKGDLPAFGLRISAMDDDQWPPAERMAVGAWQIRGMLRAGHPSEALQKLLSLQRTAEPLHQEVQYLKLETLLGMVELVETLGDAAVLQQTVAEFETQRASALRSTSGVWRECCEQVTARFRRIQQVGTAAASVLETAEQLTAAQQFAEARQLIIGIADRLPAGANERSRGALQLLAGELSVRLEDWSAAKSMLTTSVALYETVHDEPKAAAADLLRVYVTGRQWETGADRDPAGGEYATALRRHIERFPKQETTRTAREWLIRLLRSHDAVAAAGQLMSLAEQYPEDPASVAWVIDAGELLLAQSRRSADDRAGQSRDAQAPTSGVGARDVFRRLAQSLTGGADPRMSPSQRAALQVQRIEMSLQEADGTAVGWTEIREQLRQAQTDLDSAVASAASTSTPSAAGFGELPSAELASLQFRCRLLQLVAGIRSSLESPEAETLGRILKQATPAEQLLAIRFLHRQYSGKPSGVGDLLLARTVQQLLPLAISNAREIGQQTELLEWAAAAGTLTGDRTLQEQLMAKLLSVPLSEQQMSAMAAVMSLSSGNPDAALSESARPFWQMVLKRSPQGSDRWLEASLQTAMLHEQSGQREQAQRILNVVEVLYPEWGNTARREQAARLQLRLQGNR